MLKKSCQSIPRLAKLPMKILIQPPPKAHGAEFLSEIINRLMKKSTNISTTTSMKDFEMCVSPEMFENVGVTSKISPIPVSVQHISLDSSKGSNSSSKQVSDNW